MVVYHLNIFIGTVLCVPHVITNVTVALMFGILYPERDLNPQFLFRKLDFKSSVYTIPPPGCVSPNEISLEWIFSVFPIEIPYASYRLKSQPLLGGELVVSLLTLRPPL